MRFHLHPDRLEISHNGKPFDERDIVGICGIGEGTKAGDYTQIGKFGIGFKSVYAYSFFPQIHSETEHFKISRFVEPYEIGATSSEDTLIVLPFDQPDKRPEWAFRKNIDADAAQSEISQAVTKLNIRTLLFLHNIEKIEWILANGEQGFLTKKNKSANKENNWRIVELSDHQGKREQWHIFARTIAVIDEDKEQQVTVEVAFLIDQNGKVIKASDTELVVSFPTEKKTELGFLIQAPFKATKSRDNIKSDDPANHQMLKTAAQLAADSLAVLRDAGCLDITSYNALPLDEEDFPKECFFRPVFDKVREALKKQSLLPAYNGSFIKADEAKLARGKELVDLFAPEQLGVLFGKQQLVWLDSSITSDKLPYFHEYLLGLIDGIQITSDSLVPKLTAEFLKVQTINWLIKFIEYVEDGAKALKRTPFIRLQSGKQVTLPDKPTEPTVWFAPDQNESLDLSAFPLVHADLTANESVREFLEKEGIRKIDAVDLVIKSILPKYQHDVDYNPADYLNDLQQIANAYSGDDETKRRLETQLANIAWLACVQASDDAEKEVIWKRPNIKGDLFARPEKLEVSFSELDNGKIYFLHPIFEKQFDEHPSFKNYLANKCVRGLDEASIVEHVILPKYKNGNRPFYESEYRGDLQWIVKTPSVSGLKDTPWVACIHASNNMPNEIVWKKPNGYTPDSELTIYERNSDFETWFSGLENVDAYFLHPSVEGEFEQDQLRNLLKPIQVLTNNLEESDSKTVTLSKSYMNHKRGFRGFNPDTKIIGLKDTLTNWHIDRFKILWSILLKSPRIISGETQCAKNALKLDAAPKEIEYTEVGKLCREANCVPDKQGNWHKPNALFLHDLPDEFDTESVYAKDVAEKLGMKKPEVQQAINVIAGDDPIKLGRLERFLSATEDEQEKMLKIIPQEIPPQPAPSFKEGLGNLFRPQRGSSSTSTTDKPTYPLNNPERYQNKINQEIDEKVALHQTTPQTIRFTLVRESSSNQKARDFLYEEYQGKCQITGNTFPKASSNIDGNAENYFEACSLLSYTNADYLNDVGNMLCVSADTMAKLKNASFEWLDDLEPIIEDFNNRQPAEIENVKAKIKLAGDECEITWSERHFARLVALWEKA